MRRTVLALSGGTQGSPGLRLIVVLLAAVSLAGVGQLFPPRHASAAVTIAQRIGDPSYINPAADAGDWNRLIGSTAGAVGITVANVLNGPDYAPDPSWAAVMQREHQTGTKVIAYVDTGYFGTTGLSTRSGSTTPSDWTGQIEHDVNTWYAFYGANLDGVFFDQGQNACGPASGSNAWADLYTQINAYVKVNHPGAMTVINPGAVVPQCYENAADVLMTFEGSYTTYVNNYVPLSWNPVDPAKIWHAVYGAPTQADMENALALSASRNAGYVFVTDDVPANPYDTLPASPYWADEVDHVTPGGTAPGTAPSVPSPPTSSSVTGTQVAFSWAASTVGSASLAGYDVYQDGVKSASVPAGTTTYTATGLTASVAYSFTVAARDVLGDVSRASAPLAVTTAAGDAQPPSAPSGVTASSTTYTSTTLSWTASTDADDGVAGYDVLAGNQKVLSVPATTTSLVVGGLGAGPSSYIFAVVARDVSGNTSAPSNTAVVVTQSLPGGSPIAAPTVSPGAGTITYSAQYLMPYEFRRVFISTGAGPCFWTGSVPPLCADYVIENSALLHYSGTGTEWSWSTVSASLAPTVSGSTDTWVISDAQIGSPPAPTAVFNADGYGPLSYCSEGGACTIAGPPLAGEAGTGGPAATGGAGAAGGPAPSRRSECRTCTGDPLDTAAGGGGHRATGLAVPRG